MASPSKVKSLDRIFSKFIRLRDSKNGIFKCCSCGQFKKYEQADAGHFINRRWKSVRWNEKNVHAQCRSCNRFDEGNAVGYAKFMLKKYGEKQVDLLMSKKNIHHKFTDFELDILIKQYKEKAKELEK